MYDEQIKRLRELASIPEHCENVADCDQCSKEDICLSFTNKRIIEVATQAADAIEELTDTNVGKWIPVTERLPFAESGDVSQKVLVTDGRDMAIAEWFNFEMCEPYWSYTGIGNITHWMPLPTPPMEK